MGGYLGLLLLAALLPFDGLLLLVPTAFVWPEVWAMLDPPWQPAIVYPPRGLGALWEPPLWVWRPRASQVRRPS